MRLDVADHFTHSMFTDESVIVCESRRRVLKESQEISPYM